MLSETSIKNPVFAWMSLSFILLFGTLSVFKLPVSQLPDVDFPILTISLTLEGASASIMEKDVVDIIEEATLTVEGVKELRSVSKTGLAYITVELELNRDVDVALQEIQTKIAQVSNKLPQDLDPPVLTKSNPDDVPIIWVIFTANNFSAKDRMVYVNESLKDQFQKIPGVGEIFLGGYSERAINVYLDPVKLTQAEITVDDIINTIREQNLEIPSGRIENSEKEINLRAIGDVPSTIDFSNIYINSRSGIPLYKPIRLGDIARIEDGLSEIRRISRFNGKPSVGIGIKKLKNANAVAVAERVKEKVAELRPRLPKDSDLNVSIDNTQFIRESLEELSFTMVLSAILTGLVCRLFLGNWSNTINVLFAIPTSILGTFAFIYLFGFTINTFTLLGLALSTGIVVDDAIMVLENIHRHKSMGKSFVEAALDGAKEIRFPALAATFAIIAIFLPVAFVNGVIGRYFLEFGVTVSVAVLISLFEALSFTPMRASLQKKETKKRKFDFKVDSCMEYLNETYKRSLVIVLKKPKTFLVASSFLFIASLFLFQNTKKEFVPSQDISRFLIRAKASADSSLFKTDEEVKKIEDYLKTNQTIDRYFVAVGGFEGGDVNTAIFFVVMKERKFRPLNNLTNKTITQADCIQTLRKELPKVNPNLSYSVQDLSLRGFSSGRGYPIEVLLKGGNWDALESKAGELIQLWKSIPEITDVDTDLIQGKKEIHILPDRYLSAKNGVSIANLGGTIGALMGGKRAGRFTENGRGYDVRVKIEKEKGESSADILSISVRNTFGEMVRIRDFLRLEEKESLQNITRVDRLRAIKLFANPEKGKGLSDAIETTLSTSQKILPPEIFMETTGSAKATEESFSELMFTLVLGILVSYMILGSQFNSFLKPIYILLALPFSFTGAFLALKWGDFSFNIYSFIGIILLLGLVKKNSILLMEFIDLNRITGTPLIETITNACPIRLRPILMTTCTSLVAALPPALSLGPGAETRIPMAVVILGGMTLSTIVTLYLVPVAYLIGESRRT